jgi:hypothetical protein
MIDKIKLPSDFFKRNGKGKLWSNILIFPTISSPSNLDSFLQKVKTEKESRNKILSADYK